MPSGMRLGLVVTDLDGTLLDSQRQLGARDRATLEELGARGIVRVVATGRSLFSAQRVLAADFPIDFLVFSSGPTRALSAFQRLPRGGEGSASSPGSSVGPSGAVGRTRTL